MEDSYSVENIKRLCVFMFQTCSNSQLLRRVLWISAEQTIGPSLKHKNTQPLYIFSRIRVLHLNRLKERTWLHSFVCYELYYIPGFFQVHAYIMASIEKEMPNMFGKDKAKKRIIKTLDVIFGQIEREHKVSHGDFPDIKVRIFWEGHTILK